MQISDRQVRRPLVRMKEMWDGAEAEAERAGVEEHSRTVVVARTQPPLKRRLFFVPALILIVRGAVVLTVSRSHTA
jgi:hypothetical protein